MQWHAMAGKKKKNTNTNTNTNNKTKKRKKEKNKKRKKKKTLRASNPPFCFFSERAEVPQKQKRRVRQQKTDRFT